MKETSIIIAESSDILRNGIATMLERYPGVKIAGKACDYESLKNLLETHSNYTVLLGPILRISQGASPIEMLKKKFPDTRIVEIELADGPESIFRKLN
jgi:DNA-binding NarL/FixJ family response regulator